MQPVDLSAASVRELLALFAGVMRELRTRGLVRSANNPVADLAESYVADRLRLTLAGTVTAGYDASAPDGKRYQVKARRLTSANRARQFGFIRNLPAQEFDYLALVTFAEDFEVASLHVLPHATVMRHARFTPHTNAWRIGLTRTVLADPEVRLVSSRAHD
jgi:hypothetical protein